MRVKRYYHKCILGARAGGGGGGGGVTKYFILLSYYGFSPPMAQLCLFDLQKYINAVVAILKMFFFCGK